MSKFDVALPELRYMMQTLSIYTLLCMASVVTSREMGRYAF